MEPLQGQRIVFRVEGGRAVLQDISRILLCHLHAADIQVSRLRCVGHRFFVDLRHPPFIDWIVIGFQTVFGVVEGALFHTVRQGSLREIPTGDIPVGVVHVHRAVEIPAGDPAVAGGQGYAALPRLFSGGLSDKAPPGDQGLALGYQQGPPGAQRPDGAALDLDLSGIIKGRDPAAVAQFIGQDAALQCEGVLPDVLRGLLVVKIQDPAASGDQFAVRPGPVLDRQLPVIQADGRAPFVCRFDPKGIPVQIQHHGFPGDLQCGRSRIAFRSRHRIHLHGFRIQPDIDRSSRFALVDGRPQLTAGTDPVGVCLRASTLKRAPVFRQSRHRHRRQRPHDQDQRQHYSQQSLSSFLQCPFLPHYLILI